MKPSISTFSSITNRLWNISVVEMLIGIFFILFHFIEPVLTILQNGKIKKKRQMTYGQRVTGNLVQKLKESWHISKLLQNWLWFDLSLQSLFFVFLTVFPFDFQNGNYFYILRFSPLDFQKEEYCIFYNFSPPPVAPDF